MIPRDERCALKAMEEGATKKKMMSPKMEPRSVLANVLLCVVSVALGCLTPFLVDLSRTATVYYSSPSRWSHSMKGVRGEDVLPYTTLSILRAEAFFNVLLGIVVITLSTGGWKPLLRWELHLNMLPVTLLYLMGDAVTFFSMGAGGGLLYMAIGNSKLLSSAVLSRMILGQRQSKRQWTLLVAICVESLLFSVGGNLKTAAIPSFEGAITGIKWALFKSVLSGLAAVLSEKSYTTIYSDKKLTVWHANTLLKGQSLLGCLVMSGLLARIGPVDDTPLCIATADGMGLIPPPGYASCVDRLGWDAWTWAVVAAEIGCGWAAVLMIRRLSAVAKAMCKTAAAPTMYILYCVFAVGGAKYEARRLIWSLLIAASILWYSTEGRSERKGEAQDQSDSDIASLCSSDVSTSAASRSSSDISRSSTSSSPKVAGGSQNYDWVDSYRFAPY